MSLQIQAVSENPAVTSEYPAPKRTAERRILGVRLRVVFLLIVLQAAIISWVADSEIARSVYLICYSLMLPTTLYLVATRLVPRSLFEPSELILVYIVLTATVPIVGFGGLRFLMPGMGFMPAFVDIQPVWRQYLYLLQKLPVLHDAAAAHGFFAGQASVPWPAWAGPITFWSAYLLLLSGAWLGTAAALRRIWIQEERLSFPVAAIPIQLADRRDNILRRPLFWAGLGVPVVLQSLLQLQQFFPGLPAVRLTANNIRPQMFSTLPWSAIPDLNVGYYPAAIGLAYLVPSDISFSCWFFWLVGKLSYVFGAGLGLCDGETASNRFPYREEQAAGAWIAFALLALWTARKRWQSRPRPAETRRRHGGDSLWPVVGALTCLTLAVGMMISVGVVPLVAAGTVLIYALYVICGARVRAEAGALWTFAPLKWTPGTAMNSLLGTHGLPNNSLLASGYFDLCHVDIRGQSLPFLMEGLKIAEETGIAWKTVLTWAAIGTVTALALGWWCSLNTFYAVGAATAKSNTYVLVKTQIRMTQIDSLMHNRTGWDRDGAMAVLGAGAFTALLTFLRARFVFFPFNPVGYVLSNTLTLNSFAVPFFMAWATKTLILRYGALKMYRHSVPFFIGLIVGDIFIQSFWTLIGRIFQWPVYQFLS